MQIEKLLHVKFKTEYFSLQGTKRIITSYKIEAVHDDDDVFAQFLKALPARYII